MAIIKTTLGKNLDTVGVLVDSAARVKTAYVDPRNDMNPRVHDDEAGVCGFQTRGRRKRNGSDDGAVVRR